MTELDRHPGRPRETVVMSDGLEPELYSCLDRGMSKILYRRPHLLLSFCDVTMHSVSVLFLKGIWQCKTQYAQIHCLQCQLQKSSASTKRAMQLLNSGDNVILLDIVRDPINPIVDPGKCISTTTNEC